MIEENDKNLVTNEETPEVETQDLETTNQEPETATETPAEEVKTPAAEPEVKEVQAEAASNSDDDDDDDEWWKDDDDYTDAERSEMEKLYSGTLREFHENEIVKGAIVSIGDKEVVLNIGFKSEGIVPISEFRDIPDMKSGDEVEVFIEKVEDQHGQLLLSRRRAQNMRSWELINKSMESDVILNGLVMRRTKGGFVVDISGIEAFLPGSQIDVKPVRDFDAFVGRTMEFKVVKINHAYENVVVSHKILIEAKLDEQRKEILANLEKGQVLEGMVKNMTNFGVFIDLGGVDGLLHITDISWGRINHPDEVLELDQKVNVVVLEFDDEKKRISLGMKQLTPHPWDSLPETVTEGSQIKGRVVTVAEYGVFLEVVPGVEGLIHTSEMSWSQHSKNPGETYKEGQELEAVVLNIDREDRKMSLGLKQLKDDPWADIEIKYPVASQHAGLVRNMTNYGLFVELEEGVDGLVHISDLSWTKKFNHPSEYVKVDENLDVVVLDIDKENRRLSLGHKQLTEDVWETFASIFTLGSEHTATIKRLDKKGAIVELEYGVEGTIPSKFLEVAEGNAELKQDDQAKFIVIEFNKDAKRLVLSHSHTWKEEEVVAEPKAPRGKPKSPNSKGKSAQKAPAAKASTTMLGDIDALAQLKAQMEAQEGKTPAAPKAKKKAAPKKKAAAPAKEEVKKEEVKEEEPTVVEEIVEAVKDKVEDIKETVEDVVEDIQEVIEDVVEEVKEALEGDDDKKED